MKKFFLIVFVVLFTLNLGMISYAINPKLKADDVTVDEGESFEIAYYIKDNTGIMGFAFELSYDSTAFEIVSVTKSELLNSGFFNDSIGSSNPGTVKIIWTGTENFSEDTNLFTVKFQTKNNVSGKYGITVKCLTDDTFSENWQDVNIDCDQVSVQVGIDNHTTIRERVMAFVYKVIAFIISIFK